MMCSKSSVEIAFFYVSSCVKTYLFMQVKHYMTSQYGYQMIHRKSQGLLDTRIYILSYLFEETSSPFLRKIMHWRKVLRDRFILRFSREKFSINTNTYSGRIFEQIDQILAFGNHSSVLE